MQTNIGGAVQEPVGGEFTLKKWKPSNVFESFNYHPSVESQKKIYTCDCTLF